MSEEKKMFWAKVVFFTSLIIVMVGCYNTTHIKYTKIVKNETTTRTIVISPQK